MLEKGYAVSALTYPVVKRPRIRLSIHASNTEEQIDALVNELLAWARQQEMLSPSTGSASSNAGVKELSMEVKARL